MISEKIRVLRPRRLTGTKARSVMLLATGLAAAMSLATAPAIYATPYMPFAGAVIICVWFCGFRDAIFSTAVGAIFVNYYLRPPYGQFSLTAEELAHTVFWLALAGTAAFLARLLRTSEDQAHNVLGGIAEGFFILDEDWSVVYANEAAAGPTGKPARKMIGRNYWTVVPKVLGSPIEQQLRRCAQEGVHAQFETRCPHTGKWVQLRVYPASGKVSVFLQDMSAAKEREDKLRSSLERLTTAHKAAQLGTFEWNVHTGEVMWSEDTHRIHGLTREQFDARFENWFQSVHPDDLPEVLARIQTALERKSEYYGEYRVLWPNGETHWVGAHGQVVVDGEGNTTGMVGVCSDITHRHLEEEALRRSEKLAATGRLAATIAHEINNPLAAITNLVYLLRQDKDNKPDTQEMLRMAEEQLARVNHIVKQTLGFYREGNVPEAVDVPHTLDNLLSILESRINARAIRVEREYETTFRLTGFRGELRQVLSNLLTNAIDASPRGGRLVVRVKPERDGNKVPRIRIEIEDFGSGIPPGDQARIFEPFFTTKADAGTGLGLWVTKELVEKNGGTLSFRSSCEQGRSGTCFSIVLPTAMNAKAVVAVVETS